jgi:hypothetical protein
MEVKELGHLVLYVRDLQRSVVLYRTCSAGRSSPPTSRHARRGLLERSHPPRAPADRGRPGPAHPCRPPRRSLPLRLEGRRHRRRAPRGAGLAQEAGATSSGRATTPSPTACTSSTPTATRSSYIDVPGVDWKNNPEAIVTPPARSGSDRRRPRPRIRRAAKAGVPGCRSKSRWCRGHRRAADHRPPRTPPFGSPFDHVAVAPGDDRLQAEPSVACRTVKHERATTPLGPAGSGVQA